jgi:hypothetical protein
LEAEMSFVPITPPPSPRARELGTRISAVVEEFTRQNPGTSAEEVRQALRLVAQKTGSVRTQRAALAVIIALLLIGLLVLLTSQDGDTGGWGMTASVGFLLVLGILIVLAKRKSMN